MGCANFFKFHPDATFEQYCKKFGYDEGIIEYAVKKTEQYKTASAQSEEQRLMKALLELDTMKVTDDIYLSSANEMAATYSREATDQEHHPVEWTTDSISDYLTVEPRVMESAGTNSMNNQNLTGVPYLLAGGIGVGSAAAAMPYDMSVLLPYLLERKTEPMVVNKDTEENSIYRAEDIEYLLSEEFSMEDDETKRRIFIRTIRRFAKNGSAFYGIQKTPQDKEPIQLPHRKDMQRIFTKNQQPIFNLHEVVPSGAGHRKR